MSKKKVTDSFRVGGRRFEVYNERLCVYLQDEALQGKLRDLIKKKGEPGNTFYDNFSLPAFAKAVTADGVAVSYHTLPGAMGLRSFIGKAKFSKKLADLNPKVLPAAERQPIFGSFPA